MYTAWAMDQVKTLTSDDRGGGDNGKYVSWPTCLRMRATAAVTSVGGIQKLEGARRRAIERTLRATYWRRLRCLPLSPVQCCRSRRYVRPRVFSLARRRSVAIHVRTPWRTVLHVTRFILILFFCIHVWNCACSCFFFSLHVIFF